MGTPASATGNSGRNKGVGEMKLSAKSAAWLLTLLLTGCIHKTQVAQNQPLAPPVEETPPSSPSLCPTNLPPPDVTIPVQPEPQIRCPCGTHQEAGRSTRSRRIQNEVASNRDACCVGDRTADHGDPPNMRQQTDAIDRVDREGPERHQRKLEDRKRRGCPYSGVPEAGAGCDDGWRY